MGSVAGFVADNYIVMVKYNQSLSFYFFKFIVFVDEPSTLQFSVRHLLQCTVAATAGRRVICILAYSFVKTLLFLQSLSVDEPSTLQFSVRYLLHCTVASIVGRRKYIFYFYSLKQKSKIF